jgi:hypothetical protein
VPPPPLMFRLPIKSGRRSPFVSLSSLSSSRPGSTRSRCAAASENRAVSDVDDDIIFHDEVPRNRSRRLGGGGDVVVVSAGAGGCGSATAAADAREASGGSAAFPPTSEGPSGDASGRPSLSRLESDRPDRRSPSRTAVRADLGSGSFVDIVIGALFCSVPSTVFPIEHRSIMATILFDGLDQKEYASV